LRAEINGRISSRATLLGFLAASVALFSKDSIIHGDARYGVVVVVLLIGGTYWWISRGLLNDLAAHVRDIEKAINKKGKDAYGADSADDLLSWESSRAGKVPGVVGSEPAAESGAPRRTMIVVDRPTLASSPLALGRVAAEPAARLGTAEEAVLGLCLDHRFGRTSGGDGISVAVDEFPAPLLRAKDARDPYRDRAGVGASPDFGSVVLYLHEAG
jgi:hypothetical protein